LESIHYASNSSQREFGPIKTIPHAENLASTPQWFMFVGSESGRLLKTATLSIGIFGRTSLVLVTLMIAYSRTFTNSLRTAAALAET
jgi:hypothetical protein